MTDENVLVDRNALMKINKTFIQTLSCEGFQCRAPAVWLFSSASSFPPNPGRQLVALDGKQDTN